MNKKTLIGGVIVLLLILLSLWQLGFFGRSPGVCDPPPGSLGGLIWREALVDTDGSFYVRVVNPKPDTLTFTSISITSPEPTTIIYTVGTPQLPFKVEGKDELLISGKYDYTENLRGGDEYWLYVDINFTYVVIDMDIEDKSSGSILGKYGVVEVPEPC